MPTIASVIVWDSEPLAQIKEAVESCSHLARSVSESSLAAEGYSYSCILATAQKVVSQHPKLNDWIRSLPPSLDLKLAVAEAGIRYDTILANANSAVMFADCVVFHDITIARAINWIMAELQEAVESQEIYPVPENCLVLARSNRDSKVHIAICPSQEAYLNELKMFTPADMQRKVGWFKKEYIEIRSLDDFVAAMVNVAKRKGWSVKESSVAQ